jgi:hypothetical protein
MADGATIEALEDEVMIGDLMDEALAAVAGEIEDGEAQDGEVQDGLAMALVLGIGDLE